MYEAAEDIPLSATAKLCRPPKGRGASDSGTLSTSCIFSTRGILTARLFNCPSPETRVGAHHGQRRTQRAFPVVLLSFRLEAHAPLGLADWEVGQEVPWQTDTQIRDCPAGGSTYWQTWHVTSDWSPPVKIWSMMQLQWLGLLAFFPLSSPVEPDV